MIGNNEVMDSREVRLLSKISLYEVYQVDNRLHESAFFANVYAIAFAEVMAICT